MFRWTYGSMALALGVVLAFSIAAPIAALEDGGDGPVVYSAFVAVLVVLFVWVGATEKRWRPALLVVMSVAISPGVLMVSATLLFGPGRRSTAQWLALGSLWAAPLIVGLALDRFHRLWAPATADWRGRFFQLLATSPLVLGSLAVMATPTRFTIGVLGLGLLLAFIAFAGDLRRWWWVRGATTGNLAGRTITNARETPPLLGLTLASGTQEVVSKEVTVGDGPMRTQSLHLMLARVTPREDARVLLQRITLVMALMLWSAVVVSLSRV